MIELEYIHPSQIRAAYAAQIAQLDLKVGEFDNAVVVDKKGNLQTITFTRKS